jgi:hypothetical protein
MMMGTAFHISASMTECNAACDMPPWLSSFVAAAVSLATPQPLVAL